MTQQPHARKPSDGAPAKHPLSVRICDGIMLGEMLTERPAASAWPTLLSLVAGKGEKTGPRGWDSLESVPICLQTSNSAARMAAVESRKMTGGSRLNARLRSNFSVRKGMKSLLLACFLTYVGGCSGGDSKGPPPPPAMTIKNVGSFYAATPSLNLPYAIAGQGSFQLLVNGTGFTSSSVVDWNGSPLSTQFGDSTDLAASAPSTLIAAPGTANITVTDSGNTSKAAPFPIASPATLTAGVVALVTVAQDGTPANGDSLVPPTISVTGRYVAFQDDATNLVPGVSSNQFAQIYESDTCIGAPSGCAPSTTLITVTFDGSAVNGNSRDSAISGDGRYVAFDTQATNILASASQCAQSGCAFLRDTCTGISSGCTPTTVEVPVPAPKTGDGDPALTPDGRFVVFAAGPQPAQVYVWDTCNGAPSGCTPSTIVVSAAPDGSPGNFNSLPQTISRTGRYVSFDSFATNLVPNGPTDGFDHIFLRDTCIGAPSACMPSTIWLDQGGSAGLGGGALDVSVIPGISADGRLVAFSTNQVGLVPQNVQGGNAYVRDTCNGATSGCTPSTQLASLGNDGSLGNDPSQIDGHPAISQDGRFIAFASLASNLVPGDTFAPASFKDIFVRDTCFGVSSGCFPSTVRVSLGSPPPYGIQSNAISDFPAISADGHYVVFLSSATNLANPPSNGHQMVYIAKTGF